MPRMSSCGSTSIHTRARSSSRANASATRSAGGPSRSRRRDGGCAFDERSPPHGQLRIGAQPGEHGVGRVLVHEERHDRGAIPELHRPSRRSSRTMSLARRPVTRRGDRVASQRFGSTCPGTVTSPWRPSRAMRPSRRPSDDGSPVMPVAKEIQLHFAGVSSASMASSPRSRARARCASTSRRIRSRTSRNRWSAASAARIGSR